MFCSSCKDRESVRSRRLEVTGNLSNDDGDGNENGKKAIGLSLQNNNFARASRFFVHFFACTLHSRLLSPFFFTSSLEDLNGGTSITLKTSFFGFVT